MAIIDVRVIVVQVSVRGQGVSGPQEDAVVKLDPKMNSEILVHTQRTFENCRIKYLPGTGTGRGLVTLESALFGILQVS